MSVRRQHGDKWYFRTVVKLKDGTSKRMFGVPGKWGLPNTKVAALEAERRAIAEALGLGPPQEEVRPPGSTLSDFAPTFLASSEVANKHSSVSSKEQILRDHLLPALGHLPLRGVTYSIIEDHKIHLLSTGLSRKTVNNILTVLRSMLSLAAKRGMIPSIPQFEWLKVDRQKFDFLTFEEAERLLGGAEEEWCPLLLVALRTGMRHGELLGLRWEDVDLRAGRLMVRQAIVRNRVTTPKNHREREIPLGDGVLATLKSIRHLRGPLVFCSPSGAALTRASCKWPLWRACAKAGLRRIGWHVLRHTFASHLAMRGVPLKVIQELMGHSTIQMTMRYAHLAPEVARDAVRLLDERIPLGSRK